MCSEYWCGLLLGRQRSWPAGQRFGGEQCAADSRLREPGVQRSIHRAESRTQLRPNDIWCRLLLGRKRHWPAWQLIDHGQPRSGRGLRRPDLELSRDGLAIECHVSWPQLRNDDVGGGLLLGRQFSRPARRRNEDEPPGTRAGRGAAVMPNSNPEEFPCRNSLGQTLSLSRALIDILTLKLTYL